MICSKCNNEIQEGEKFCSNCGKKIKKRENSSNEKNEKHSKVNKKLIYIIISIVVIIGIVVGILLLNNGDTSNDNNIGNNIVTSNNSSNEIKAVYITKDSEVSPTGKEFIGEFSQTIRDILENSIHIKTSIEETTIPHLKQYVCTYYIYSYSTNPENLTERQKEQLIKEGKAIGKVFTEQKIYYNELNNKVIAHREIINDVNKFVNSMEQRYGDIEKYNNINFNSILNIFMNFPNEQTDTNEELYYNYCEFCDKQGISTKKFQDNVNIYNYEIYGKDMLSVKLDLLGIGNRYDVLYLAYDENTNVEEVIKNWYNNVKDIDSENSNINNVESKIEYNNNEEVSTTTTNSSSAVSSSNMDTSSNYSNKETVRVPNFSLGYELKHYTEDLDSLGIKYKIVKEQNLDYKDNTVAKVEHNGENIEKGTTITITVADNKYDMNINVNTEYLVSKAGLSESSSLKEVSLVLKINEEVVFNGTTPVENSMYEKSFGIYKGKPNNLNIEATIQGKTITLVRNVDYMCTDNYDNKYEIVINYCGGLG